VATTAGFDRRFVEEVSMRSGFGTLLVIAVVGVATSAEADWRMTRGDVRRTGAVTGDGELTAPALRWRKYLGGFADARSARPTTSSCSRHRVASKRDDPTTRWCGARRSAAST
jgi:hypothetical protein